jgi:hypothetical protein
MGPIQAVLKLGVRGTAGSIVCKAMDRLDPFYTRYREDGWGHLAYLPRLLLKVALRLPSGDPQLPQARPLSRT